MRKSIAIFLVFASILFGQTASISDTVAFVSGNVSIPVIITDVVELEGVELTIQYDETVLTAMSTSFENTELDGMNFNVQLNLDTSGEIRVVAYAGTNQFFSGGGNLIFINFDVIGQLSESTDLIFTSIEINNISILESAQNGSVTVHQLGCMDADACNYNASATYDEGNYCNELDCENICGGITIYDCNGECGGLALIDECGICGGSGPTEECGCEQIPQGDCDCNGNVNDICDVCGGDGCHQGDCETYPADEFDCYGVLLSTDLLSPFEFKLLPNYPNPFNPSTTINYLVATFAVVNISIYSVSGELTHTLVNTSQQPGQYAIQWNASNSPSGLYFVKLKSENEIAEQKVLLIK